MLKCSWWLRGVLVEFEARVNFYEIPSGMLLEKHAVATRNLGNN
jgi:hypothetical protein